MKQWKQISKLAITVAALALAGCNKGDRSFSLLADQSSFSETPTFNVIPQKIDILWVIDNSNSMDTSQAALTANFNRFITKFQASQYDFHMAVTSTDAYQGAFNNLNELRKLRDGAMDMNYDAKFNPYISSPGTHSGIQIMDRNTTALSSVFVTNASQGKDGSGDERAFSSFEDVLSYAPNAGFRRADAYLAIIIVSDEDDFSSRTFDYLSNDYNAPNLIPVSHYKTYLDGLAGVGNYSVNAITILDSACRDVLLNDFAGRRIGQRYIDLANLTGGVKASLCDDFGTNLQLISDTITQKNPVNATYKLSRDPIVASLSVQINGAIVAQDPNNGWTYDEISWVVTLHGTAAQAIQDGGTVAINYDPKNPKN